MRIPQEAVQLASGTDGGPTVLGEGLVAWRTALIAAVVAAVLYELAMAATRKITLRLPFLILYLARITVSRAQWRRLHGEWVAELHYVLRDDSAPWLGRLVNGLRYAAPLALGGARNTVRAGDSGPNLIRRTIKRSRIPLLGAWTVSATALQSFRDSQMSWLTFTLAALAVSVCTNTAVTVVRDYRCLRDAGQGTNRDQ